MNTPTINPKVNMATFVCEWATVTILPHTPHITHLSKLPNYYVYLVDNNTGEGMVQPFNIIIDQDKIRYLDNMFVAERLGEMIINLVVENTPDNSIITLGRHIGWRSYQASSDISSGCGNDARYLGLATLNQFSQLDNVVSSLTSKDNNDHSLYVNMPQGLRLCVPADKQQTSSAPLYRPGDDSIEGTVILFHREKSFEINRGGGPVSFMCPLSRFTFDVKTITEEIILAVDKQFPFLVLNEWFKIKKIR